MYCITKLELISKNLYSLWLSNSGLGRDLRLCWWDVSPCLCDVDDAEDDDDDDDDETRPEVVRLAKLFIDELSAATNEPLKPPAPSELDELEEELDAKLEHNMGRLNGQLVFLLGEFFLYFLLISGRRVLFGLLLQVAPQRHHFFPQVPQLVLGLCRLVLVGKNLQLVNGNKPLELASVFFEATTHQTIAKEHQVAQLSLVAVLDQLDDVLVFAHLLGHYVAVDFVEDQFAQILGRLVLKQRLYVRLQAGTVAVGQVVGRQYALFFQAVDELEELGGPPQYVLGENFGQVEQLFALGVIVVQVVGVLFGGRTFLRESRQQTGPFEIFRFAAQQLVELGLALGERFALGHTLRVVQLAQNGHRFGIVFEEFQVDGKADLHYVGQQIERVGQKAFFQIEHGVCGIGAGRREVGGLSGRADHLVQFGVGGRGLGAGLEQFVQRGQVVVQLLGNDVVGGVNLLDAGEQNTDVGLGPAEIVVQIVLEVEQSSELVQVEFFVVESGGHKGFEAFGGVVVEVVVEWVSGARSVVVAGVEVVVGRLLAAAAAQACAARLQHFVVAVHQVAAALGQIGAEYGLVEGQVLADAHPVFVGGVGRLGEWRRVVVAARLEGGLSLVEQVA
ncbi:hypothetical protein BpHYR1_031510 [Brachionus plicatilis]|uniref:Uncharacterized protein n=1 Tax=Brachionus plicatilis TaxID=10195 RepID=A0A3M7T1Q7_BRAPC|nr:hypothetical protein BpHYR1_031510 [Brachionus plicatilis]